MSEELERPQRFAQEFTAEGTARPVPAPPALGRGPASLVHRLRARASELTRAEALELAAYALLIIAAGVLRFWDLGARALHHDESLHATYSWYLATGQGYKHDPMMHGPFLFHATALIFVLFGASDYTARVVPALFGTGLIVLPWFLRERLGRVGALAASLMFAVSPSLMYYSRFIRDDPFVVFFTLGMVVGIFRYLSDGRARWLYFIAAMLTLSYSSLETTYILVAGILLALEVWLAAALARSLRAEHRWSGGTTLATAVLLFPVAWLLAILWPGIERARTRWRLNTRPRVADLLLTFGLLAAPQFAAAVEKPLHLIGVSMNARTNLVGHMVSNEQLFGTLTVLVLLIASLQIGLAWDRRRFLTMAAIFYVPYVLLYTTFFTNPAGFASGIWGSLSYWLTQQTVNRGNQPVYYYVTLLPIYEFLPLAVALIGVVRLAARRRRDALGNLLLVLFAALVMAAAAFSGNRSAPLTVILTIAALAALVVATRDDPFRQFLVFWAGAMLFGLSVAGEKMPWLVEHIALPLVLLAAATVGDTAEPLIRAARAAFRPAVGGLAVTILAGAGAAAALVLAPSGSERWLAAALLLLVAGATAVAMRARWRLPVGMFLLAGPAVLGLVLTTRASLILSFRHGDIPVEALVYTQTAPDVPRVMQEIRSAAKASGLGHDLPITVDATDAFTWPWAWYLRNYHNVSYPDLTSYVSGQVTGFQPTPVLLVNASNVAIVNQVPGYYDSGQRYHHRWWFPEQTYRGLTADSFLAHLGSTKTWEGWWNYWIDRKEPYPLGSVDAFAFFQKGLLQGKTGAASGPTTFPDGGIQIGSGAGAAFAHPVGMATALNGDLLIADSSLSRVYQFSPSGKLVRTIGAGTGALAGQLQQPWGVAVGRDGSIYVADTWNHRIERLDASGNYLASFGSGGYAKSPTDYAHLYGPRGIAVAPDGTIWVTDTGNERVLHLSADLKPLGAFGTKGSGPGQFDEPVGIAVGVDGSLWVADTWNGRIAHLSPSGAWLGSVPVPEWASDHGVENKPYLTIANGWCYFTVPTAGEVRGFPLTGDQPQTVVHQFEGDAAGLQTPLGVAVDARGRLWWTEAGAARARAVVLPH